jgi:hypothetical protein
VQATATVPTGAELADHLAKGHLFTGMHRADYRLVCGANSTVVKADHWLAADRPYERHSAIRSGMNCLARLGDKINTAMTGSPDHPRGIEPSSHHRGAIQRPGGGCGQSTDRCNGRWNGEHA